MKHSFIITSSISILCFAITNYGMHSDYYDMNNQPEESRIICQDNSSIRRTTQNIADFLQRFHSSPHVHSYFLQEDYRKHIRYAIKSLQNIKNFTKESLVRSLLGIRKNLFFIITHLRTEADDNKCSSKICDAVALIAYSRFVFLFYGRQDINRLLNDADELKTTKKILDTLSYESPLLRSVITEWSKVIENTLTEKVNHLSRTATKATIT